MAILLVEVEKKGIPAVLEAWDVPDLKRITHDNFMLRGIPQCREVYTPPDPRLTSISEYAQEFIDALTLPLTEKEMESGHYVPPTRPRIAFTGTFDEVQDYFIGDPDRVPLDSKAAPMGLMTDGLPVVPPTEEKVAEMLTGTSHSFDEVLWIIPLKGEKAQKMEPKELRVTVEMVATNAVMAGCKPEHLPVVLAIAETAPPVSYPGDSSLGAMYIVSGPIAKEIRMNSYFCATSPGNPANSCIGRAATLVGINCGGVEMGLTNPNRTGNPLWSLTFAEATERSPWQGINVNEGYGEDESILMACYGSGFFVPLNTGEVITPHNLDEVLVSTPENLVETIKIARKAGGPLIMLTPYTAKKWYEDYRFETIKELQDYLWENTTWSLGEFKSWYWHYQYMPVIEQNERGSRTINPDHLELPDDAQIPMFIGGPETIKIVVSGGDGDGWGFGGWRYRTSSIDKWR